MKKKLFTENLDWRLVVTGDIDLDIRKDLDDYVTKQYNNNIICFVVHQYQLMNSNHKLISFIDRTQCQQNSIYMIKS